jgi:hypothetical protein
MQKPKEKPARTLFAIFLMEDEDGRITVRSDYIGQGKNSFDIGVDILERLQFLSRHSDKLRIENVMMSSYPN